MIRHHVIGLRRRDGRRRARGRRARPASRPGGPAGPRARAHGRVPRPRARRGAGAVGRGRGEAPGLRRVAAPGRQRPPLVGHRPRRHERRPPRHSGDLPPGHRRPHLLPPRDSGHPPARGGRLLNGTMRLAAAGVFHRLTLTPGLRRALAGGLIVTVWGNAIFYVVAACLTTGRGLSFGANRFGGGDWFNSVGYLTAMVAVFAVILALALIVRGALATARQAMTD